MPFGRRNLHPFKFNRVISLLTVSDIFTWGIYTIVISLVGIYLAEKFGLSAIKIVGVGTAVYTLTRALTQVPVGIITDKLTKDNDEIVFLAFGNILMGVPFILFPYVVIPQQYYILQFIFGIASTLNIVSWRKLFAKNLDKNKEGLEYGTYDTVLYLAMTVFSPAAAFIASVSTAYFDIVLKGIGIVMMLAAIFPLMLFVKKKQVESRKK